MLSQEIYTVHEKEILYRGSKLNKRSRSNTDNTLYIKFHKERKNAGIKYDLSSYEYRLLSLENRDLNIFCMHFKNNISLAKFMKKR
jgi:hypothetical protein